MHNFYEYENFKSVLEVGAGELTIIAELMNRIGDKNSSILKGALDISFQRLLEGKKLVESKNLNFDYIEYYQRKHTYYTLNHLKCNHW